jgi:hypothetical protein
MLQFLNPSVSVCNVTVQVHLFGGGVMLTLFPRPNSSVALEASVVSLAF